ncbi:hypothetical protein PPERSA_03363 [Pseudocohnilembus persalinus]|uniref:ubiquitinyl hydrolase 1 n=1 Tax=Pseudocohnilembus persalinus TaxID=266149 RepID=A0A0V0R1K2_PSEPJ|nr:hypothetical protein PPERSA_03363 [Pseudocohnilembus persalinus]|eukprot:KRX08369.1 hypothetical protein PPERSA_03363 [Pseudocohnilembus persalinus]
MQLTGTYKRFPEEFFEKETIPFVSQPLDLDVKIKEYKNQKIIDALQQYKQKVPIFRQIRGDGNCFYRAFYYYLFELILLKSSENQQYLKVLNDLLKDCSVNYNLNNVCYLESLEKENKIQYIGKYNLGYIIGDFLVYVLHEGNKNKEQIKQKFEYVVRNYPIFDFACILYIRALALKGLKQFESEYGPYYLGDEEKIIKTFGQEAEGVIFRLIAKQLNISLQIYGFQQSEKIEEEFGQENPIIQDIINLFFRPDVINQYTQQQLKSY